MKNTTFMNIAKPAILVLLIMTGYLFYKVMHLEKSANIDSKVDISSEDSILKTTKGPIVRTAGEVVDSSDMDYEDIKLFSQRYFAIVEKVGFSFGKTDFNTKHIVSKTTMREPLGFSHLIKHDKMHTLVGFRVENSDDIETITPNTRVVLSRIAIPANLEQSVPAAVTQDREIVSFGEGTYCTGQKYKVFLELRDFIEGQVISDIYIVVEGEEDKSEFFLLKDSFFHQYKELLDRAPKLQTKEELKPEEAHGEKPFQPLPKETEPEIPEMH